MLPFCFFGAAFFGNCFFLESLFVGKESVRFFDQSIFFEHFDTHYLDCK